MQIFKRTKTCVSDAIKKSQKNVSRYFRRFWEQKEEMKQDSASLMILNREERMHYILLARNVDLDYLTTILSVLKKERREKEELTAREFVEFIKSCIQDYDAELRELKEEEDAEEYGEDHIPEDIDDITSEEKF